MNIQRQLYQDLAQLPPQELTQLLAEVLPYGEIKARMDGTVVLIHAYGLRRFQSTADRLELGIPEDDPRSEVFTATMQSLVSEKIQNELRNHSARMKTVCRDAGAIEVWGGAQSLVGAGGVLRGVCQHRGSAHQGIRLTERPPPGRRL